MATVMPVFVALLCAAGPKQTFVYKTVEGCEIKADVHRPADDGVRPVILWLHGGALIAGHRGNIQGEQLERYLQSGYIVVAADYRLAPETKLPGIIEDLQDVHRWIREKGPELFKADPGRIAVVGHSAGAYLTLMAGFCLEPRPQAIVSLYGYGDVIGDWYSKPDPYYSRQAAVSDEAARKAVGTKEVSEDRGGRGAFYLYCRQKGIWPNEVGGHDPVKERNFFKRYCPLVNVDKKYSPTLLIHGDQDTDVPFEQSVNMAAVLKARGVKHEFLPQKGRGHGFDLQGLKDPALSALFDQIVAFLKKNGV